MDISGALGWSLFRTKTEYEPGTSSRGDLIRAQDVHRRPNVVYPVRMQHGMSLTWEHIVLGR